jgi:hypothetical protein
MKVAYFVHDLSDAAVARRLRMLRAAGTDVTVIGFRRAAETVSELVGFPVFDLGRTYDAQMRHRAGQVLAWSLRNGAFRDRLGGAQVFLARNLEMLAVAAAARRAVEPRPPLVYECLDIHRMMLADSAPGRLARATERALMRLCDLLIVSSPAFLSGYFEPVQKIGRSGLKTLLVENKTLDLDAGATSAAFEPRPPGPPWRIGWFGVLRCRKSLNILTALAARRPDLVQLVVRGRPTPAVFENFDAAIDGVPAIRFGGPYDPSELPGLYRETHFTWAVDYYDEGLNSAMLIPNRLYDAGAHRSVPLALAGVETGRWLAAHGLGVLFDDPLRELETFFERLDADGYRRLEARSAAADPRLFRADTADCERLGAALASVLRQPRTSDDQVRDSEPFLAPAAGRALPQ